MLGEVRIEDRIWKRWVVGREESLFRREMFRKAEAVIEILSRVSEGGTIEIRQ